VTQILAPSLSAETITQVNELIRRLERKDVLEITHPRVKLEEFFLKIVEEAQAANVRTYGARAGGAMPEFLQKATEATQVEIIESLVSAGSRRMETVAPVEPLPPKPEPSRQVIEQLVASRPTAEDAPAQSSQSTSQPAEPSAKARVEADEAVIDSLLGDAARSRETRGGGS
jgi:hypothetical protein